MSHVPSRDPAETPELARMFRAAEAAMGLLPNSMLTMATCLEALPGEFAGEHLRPLGWQAGKHG